MRLDYSLDPSGDLIFSGRVASGELLNERIAETISKEIVSQIAETAVKEKGAEIMARVDLTAVANMVIVRLADRIASQLTLNHDVK